MAFVRNVIIFQFLALAAFIQVNRGSQSGSYLDIYPKSAKITLKNKSSALYFGLMLSLSSDDQSSGTLAGVQAALDEVNSRDDLLPGYSLHYTLTDSKCNKTAALDQLFLQLLDSPHPKVALIESGCSAVTEATAEISQHFNIIHISTSATVLSSEFSDDEHVRFPYYFQLLPSEVNLARVFYNIIKEYTWKRVALIIQNEHRFKTTMYKLMELLSNSTITYTEVYFDNNYKKLLGQESAFDPQFRVYILAMNSRSARYFLCQAYGLGLKYPKYLFLTYGTYEFQWWTIVGNDVDCNPEDLAEVLQYSLAAMYHHEPPSDDQLYNLHYDATRVLAYALDDVIKYGDPPWDASETNVSGSGSEYSCLVDYKSKDFAPMLMRRHLFSTNLTGLSGPITFDENGIRMVTELKVLQYRKTYPNGTLISDDRITNASSNNGLKLIEVAIVKENSETSETLSFIMGDKYTIWPGYIPYDGSPREELVTILVPVTVIFSFLNICGIACAMICLLFNIIFRNRKIIRLNSPNLNYFIISGAIIMFVSGTFFVLPTSIPVVKSTTCIIRAWLVAIGHSLGFGTVIAKLWRIYIIFKHPRKAQRKAGIKDWHLMLIVFGQILIDIIILTIYTALEGFSAHFSAGKEPNKEKLSAVVGEQDIDTVYFVTTCSAKSWIRQGSISIIHFYKGILHICALYFAFQTRKIKIKALNDAKYIIMFTYTASIILAIAAVAVIILQSYHNAYAAVYNLGIWLASFAILGFLFVPKMVLLYKDPDGMDVFPTQTGPQFTVDMTQGGQQDFVDIDAFKHKIKQLENELMKIKYNKKMPANNEETSQGSQVQE